MVGFPSNLESQNEPCNSAADREEGATTISAVGPLTSIAGFFPSWDKKPMTYTGLTPAPLSQGLFPWQAKRLPCTPHSLATLVCRVAIAGWLLAFSSFCFLAANH